MLHLHGRDHPEGELRHRLARYATRECLNDPGYSPEKQGYSDEAIAHLCQELGLRPCIRRIPGLHPHQKVQVEWLMEGSEQELEEWLRKMVDEGRPVKVSLRVWRYLYPQELLPLQDDLGSHSVVVTGFTADKIRFLQTDPRGQHGYPKTGEFCFLSRGHFLAAWKDAYYSAFSIEGAGSAVDR